MTPARRILALVLLAGVFVIDGQKYERVNAARGGDW